MFNAVQDYTLSILPSKKRRSQAGWLSFNAVCCQHNGESADTRGRGGVMSSQDGGISYHCFNCGFKIGYQPGRPLGFKFKRLLKWLGASESEISRLTIDALRLRELVAPTDKEIEPIKVSWDERPLPVEAQSFWALAEFYKLSEYTNAPSAFLEAVNYVVNRKIDTQKYDFYWTPEVEHKLSHRAIVPFIYQGKIVGYTARAVNNNIKPKYHSNHPAHFVFNLDNQPKEHKFVIVVEGPFDAMAIDAVSTQTNDISEQQAELIEDLGKEVIYVPDFDRHVGTNGKETWPGSQGIARAIEYGWSVCFPVWRDECKDVSAAVEKYGKLFVLKTILNSKETNSLKIKLRMNWQK